MISDFGIPIQNLLDVKSTWLAVTIFNQVVSWRFDWSLSPQANNRFCGGEVKGSSIGILTFAGEDDKSVTRDFVNTASVAKITSCLWHDV